MSHEVERAIGPVRRDELDGLFALLTDSQLPLDGLADHLETIRVAREGGRIIGSAALEIYPDGALLRSVAVAQSAQGRGLGHALIEAAIRLARDHHSPAVYLLTTSAAGYFPRFGFRQIERADVPSGVRRSVEFTTVSCSSATVMRMGLDGDVS